MKHCPRFLVATAVIAVLLLVNTPRLNAQEVTQAAWLNPYGILVNSMCRNPDSGDWWLYEVKDARPVGTACRIPIATPTGTVWEAGVVTRI